MKTRKLLPIILLTVVAFIITSTSCNTNQQFSNEPFEVDHAHWIYGATIYEVNIRQYTPEGTFAAFEEHLPRLKELGIDILWFMPIHPIGEELRKGSLGSYYSVKDYKAINPEFGNLNDFKQLVNSAHEFGMKVIIDWVANHTAHDNYLVYEKPEWYQKDSTGQIISPFDWTDVAQLDFSNEELRNYMVDALKYWIEETNIDGYRCDVAAMVPTDFWNRAREELSALKPVFLLAEADEIELQEFAFDADYAWEFHHIMNNIAQGKKTVIDIESYFQKEQETYPSNTIRMQFTSNHDENSWAGTEFERMGEKPAKAFAALSFTIPGIPLIYSGQEVAFNRMLKFFDKDEIDWTPNEEFTQLYQKLTTLRRENTALWSARKGAEMVRVHTSNDVNIFAFTRQNEGNMVFSIFNLSNLKQSITLKEPLTGSYKEIFSEEIVEFAEESTVELAPWEFLIFTLEETETTMP